MGAKAAVGILHKEDPGGHPEHEREALHEQLAAEHERIAGGVDSAIDIGVVDGKIDPPHPQQAHPGTCRGSATTRTAQEHPAASPSPQRVSAPGPEDRRTPALPVIATTTAINLRYRRSAHGSDISSGRDGVPGRRPPVRSGATVGMSPTSRAPSWVTANSNSARVTSIPSATGSAGRSHRAEVMTAASAP